MKIEETQIPEVKKIKLKRFADMRGFFCETYNKKRADESGLNIDFVQDNHSFSESKGTVRGLHYQSAPFEQDKLVWVIRGSILDVAVDIRRNSSTFGKHVVVELSASEPTQLLVPIGFAHGFCTLEPNTEVMYKVSNFYNAEHERGILWSDPALTIPWPVTPAEVALSEKDKVYPPLAEQRDLF